MIRATTVIAAAATTDPVADRVVLDFDARHRRRLAMRGEGGLEFLLDLREATPLRDGDGLVLEDGRVVAVAAALEPLTEIRASDGAHLMRLAWHLGNRHLPTEVRTDRLFIRRDHVIEEMLAGLGASVKFVSAPFEPEGGAYGQAHGESHSHSHAHGAHSHEHHDGHRHG